MLRRFVVLFACLLALAASPALAQGKKMIIAAPGIPPIFAAVQLYVAEREGFFKKQGVEVEVRPFDTGTAAARAVLAGDIDLSLSPTNLIINQISNANADVVATYGFPSPDWMLGSVVWALLGSLLIGSVPGIIVGSYISARVPDVVLRTKTTAYQARVMSTQEPPVRIIALGRCYRSEQTDATHEWMFHQIDGLAVDEGIRLSDLRGTLTSFAQQMFGSKTRTRFRCDYFPFVEPGVDFAISCYRCDGSNATCPICHGSGWLEILGAGMVHPRVLQRVGYDPDKLSGFAWGMGVERIAMIKYGVNDLRQFYENDARFLQQF